MFFFCILFIIVAHFEILLFVDALFVCYIIKLTYALLCCCSCCTLISKLSVRYVSTISRSQCPLWWYQQSRSIQKIRSAQKSKSTQRSKSTEQSKSIQRSDHPSMDLDATPPPPRLPALFAKKVRIDGWMWSHTCFTCTSCIDTRSDHACSLKKGGIFHPLSKIAKQGIQSRHDGSRCQCQECHDMVPHLTQTNLKGRVLQCFILFLIPLGKIYGGKIVETARSDQKMVQNRQIS